MLFCSTTCALNYLVFLLFLDHLTSILNDIDDIKHCYEQLGTYLGLRHADIETIKLEDRDTWRCLKNVIVKWLNRNANLSEVPNRRLLVEAIRRINVHLAIKLEEKYNQGYYYYYMCVLIKGSK